MNIFDRLTQDATDAAARERERRFAAQRRMRQQTQFLACWGRFVNCFAQRLPPCDASQRILDLADQLMQWGWDQHLIEFRDSIQQRYEQAAAPERERLLKLFYIISLLLLGVDRKNQAEIARRYEYTMQGRGWSVAADALRSRLTARATRPKESREPEPQQPKQRIDRSLSGAISKLLQLAEKGEPYTSERALAKQLGLGTTSIHNAINSSKQLLAWRARKLKRPSTVESLGKQDVRQPEELTPDDAAAMAELRSDPELMETKLQQLRQEIQRQPKARQEELLSGLNEIEQSGKPELLVLLAEQLQQDRQQTVKSRQRI